MNRLKPITTNSDRVSGTMLHAVIKHADAYANGQIHTNSIEASGR